MKDICFAGGCFWGMEHFFKMMDGVMGTEVGYANGHTVAPTYKEVCTDTTGHAETVHVTYDENAIALNDLLDLFFAAIDPTSVNKQGEDEGTQYRTGIYYVDEADRAVIDAKMAQVATHYSQPLAVEVLPLQYFYPAEDYHQDYLDKNPDGYCHISPELFKMAREFRRKSSKL